LVLQNKKVIYDLLFRTSAETLLEVARDPQHLVLKSASSACCTAGLKNSNFTRMYTRWCRPRAVRRWHALDQTTLRFLLPVEVLGAVFRGKFHEALSVPFMTAS